MKRLATILSCVGVVLSGCSLLGPGGVDGPVISRGGSSERLDALISGTVSLEGNCIYLVAGDVRFPVVWPQGAGWQADPPGVDLRGGVALLGDTVEGGGGFGQSDRVGEVAGEEAEALAEQCVEGPFQEVAIFNAGADITVTSAVAGEGS